MSNQHGGGGLAAYDETIMTWLFSRQNNRERNEKNETDKETVEYASGDADGF